jgi:hypothetical protein
MFEAMRDSESQLLGKRMLLDSLLTILPGSGLDEFRPNEPAIDRAVVMSDF